ncbi:putative bifunctional diguanylate cyclase/phosphodiesterase [Aliidiomarina celeris]|uniref:putative bifunctional diguanylate cyclase/phosphodiesterase n=1 Tax=Aliidiomarina celeris TaxID=2249428 RepID=UPI000DE80823|nr:bifunctional diguanylate cyclase/phosphodiesterase [Aliidiomarina celeris]
MKASSVSPFRHALRISLIYVVFGALWIVFSDRALEAMVADVLQLSTLQTVKGWVYVLITGLLFFLLSYATLSAQKRQNERDALTKLLNRNMFREECEVAIQQARQDHSALTLALINLDGFRQINHSAGQHVGDQVLQKVADILRQHFELQAQLGRIAGDEFALLMKSDLGNEDIIPKLERLQLQIANIQLENYPGLSLTARIGLSCFPEDGESVKSLLSSGALALEQAKLAGQGELRIYNRSYGEEAQWRSELLSDLKQAIQERSLSLMYQPQFDVNWKKLTGVEVLVRWKRGGTYVRPDVFIPLAEQSGLIHLITDFVCKQSLLELQQAQLLGSTIPRVSINVSALDLEADNCIDRFINRFADFPGDWCSIQLEITETAVMRNLDRVIQSLQELRAKGLQISVDDFGTGYSSLSVLRRLPVQEIKIDRSFIRDIKTDPSDRMIVRTILAMAHALNLRVIAEGVEDTEQVLFLKQEKCNQIQGYLMSPPLAIQDLITFLNEWPSQAKE